MIELTILTEGPDDVAALTEMFIRTGRVGTTRPINSAAASTATTRDRMHNLAVYAADKTTKSGTIKIVAVVNESTLPTKIATEIASLSINDPGAPERRFALVYDPDDKTTPVLEGRHPSLVRARRRRQNGGGGRQAISGTASIMRRGCEKGERRERRFTGVARLTSRHRKSVTPPSVK